MPQKSTFFYPKLTSGLLFHPAVRPRRMPSDWLASSAAPRATTSRACSPSCRAAPSASGRRRTARAATTRRRSTRRPSAVILDALRPARTCGSSARRSGSSATAAARVVVDPIDGSLNAKRGIPFFSISIAVAEGDTMDDVVFGYVYDFGAREEWTATRGGGAFLNGAPLDERPKDELEILSFEATTTALRLRERCAIRRRRRPPARDGLAGDHVLPPRRRPRRRCRLAEGGALGRHRRGAAARPRARASRSTLPDGAAVRRRRRSTSSARSRVAAARQRGALRGGWRPPLARLRRLPLEPMPHPGADPRTRSARVIDPELRKPVTELDMVRGSRSTAATSPSRSRSPSSAARCARFQEQVAREVGAAPGRRVGRARVRRDDARRARRADDEAARRRRAATRRSSSTRRRA